MSATEQAERGKLGYLITKAIKDAEHQAMVDKIKLRIAFKQFREPEPKIVDSSYYIERKNYENWWNGYGRFQG